jgi:asparagine synthase (glutamine-hydrolysing)
VSGLGGVVWTDGRPAAGDDAAEIINHLAYHGLDGQAVHVDGPAALGIAITHTTPESLLEQQPYTQHPSGIVVTFDGRLDDRDTLARTLGVSARVGDATLVAHAYAKWGGDMPDHLRGDFALVVWDPAARKLLAARDIVGIRPFSYAITDRGIRWATDAHAIVRGRDVSINEGMVGEVLSGSMTSLDECLFTAVCRLPPGYALRWRNGDATVWRYWTPQVGFRRRPRRDDELDEEFHALFSKAVADRLRVNGPAAILLSGGIDSSAVAATAAALRRESLTAFSLDVVDPPISERPYFTAVTRRLNLPAESRQPVDPPATVLQEDADQFLELPESLGTAMSAPLRAAIVETRHRVVLTGVGGDEWFGGTPLAAADHLARGEWRALMREVRAARRLPSGGAGRLIRLSLWLQLHERERQRLKRVLRRRRVPPWIAPAFARAAGLEERLRRPRELIDLGTHDATETYHAAMAAVMVFFREANSRITARWGLDYRHPFMDREVIEFALSLRPEQRLRDAQTKWILRRAFRNLLPAEVLMRGPGPDYSYTTAREVDVRAGNAGVEDVLSRDPGRLVPAIVRRLFRDARLTGHDSARVMARASWPLWLVFAVDSWNCARVHASSAPCVNRSSRVHE